MSFEEYRVGNRVYLYYNDTHMIKMAQPNHRARKVFDTYSDWSQGSWGIDYDAFEELRRKGIEWWVVKNTETGEVWRVDLQSAAEYGTIATLHPSDGEQLFVPLTRFEQEA